MHIELPKIRLQSPKEFLKHYLMIVLSILTALGLDAWIEHAHQTDAAETASRQMTAELRENLAETRDSLRQNDQSLQAVDQLNTILTADLRNGAPVAVINQHLQAHRSGFRLRLNWPTLPTSAWDVAVTNQSVSWIAPAPLKKYFAAYAAQRDMASWVQHESLLSLDVTRQINFSTDLDMNRPVDPQAFLYTVRQMKVTLTSMNNNLRALEKHLTDAVPDDDHASHASR